MKAKTARRVIKPWTKEDVRTLKAHSKARTPVTKVSKVMKRTVGALRRRAGILGVGLGHRRVSFSIFRVLLHSRPPAAQSAMPSGGYASGGG